MASVLSSDLAAVFLYLELECVHYIIYSHIGIYFFQFQSSLLTLKHRHLQHLFYLKAQTLGFIVDHSRYLLQHHAATCASIGR